MRQKLLKSHDICSFKTVEIGDMEKEINSINPEKTAINDSNPPKIFKKYSEVPTSVSIVKSEFSQNLKLTDIIHQSIRRITF